MWESSRWPELSSGKLACRRLCWSKVRTGRLQRTSVGSAKCLKLWCVGWDTTVSRWCGLIFSSIVKIGRGSVVKVIDRIGHRAWVQFPGYPHESLVVTGRASGQNFSRTGKSYFGTPKMAHPSRWTREWALLNSDVFSIIVFTLVLTTICVLSVTCWTRGIWDDLELAEMFRNSCSGRVAARSGRRLDCVRRPTRVRSSTTCWDRVRKSLTVTR